MRKTLKFIECPNCRKSFNKKDVFTVDSSKNTLACLKCDYIFDYPSHNSGFSSIIWGLVFIIIIPSVVKLFIIWGTGDTETYLNKHLFGTPGYLVFTAILLGTGVYCLVNGIRKAIKNSSLKRIYPDWEVRVHNTLSLTPAAVRGGSTTVFWIAYVITMSIFLSVLLSGY